MLDTARIHGLIGRARRRLRWQAALDGAVLAVVAASAAALAVVFVTRLGLLGEEVGGPLAVAVAAAIVIGGAFVAAARRLPTATVASRIDRASGLADRLGTACAFEERLAAGGEEDPETTAMMRAAIADALAHADRADVPAATPFRRPPDLRAALGFAAVAVLVGSVALDQPDRDPRVVRISPTAAPVEVAIDLDGERLCVASAAGCAAEVWFGLGEGARPAAIASATPERITIDVPADAPVGKTAIVVVAGGRRSLPHPFEVLAPGDPRYRPDDRVVLEEDEVSFTRDLLADLKATAEEMEDPALGEFADKVARLLERAERGELSKEQLLEQLAAAEKQYMEGARPEDVERSLKELSETGKQLKKQALTRPLGEALEQNDLRKAQEEMKKLAEKLASEQMSEKERAEVADAMQKAADAFEKREQERASAEQKKQAKAEAEAAKAEREARAEKDPARREQKEREAERRRKQADEMKKEHEQRQDSEQARTLKRLHRNMKKAAEETKKDPSNAENRRQASRTMEDLSRDTGKVDADRRKMASQTKTRSQLDDLREAMRRAKKGKSQGAQDRFGRNQRNQDFERRARGRSGTRSAWQRSGGQPGQGQPGQGQGQGQQPGDGQGDGDDSPPLLGDPTKMSGKTKDADLQGVHGKGPSTRQTILSAADKGFASQSYREVYGKYKPLVEEVMNAEKVPSSYKFYVKKYFQKIKPHAM